MSKGFLHSLKNITGKHGQDTRMRFSVAPLPGDSGFTQWHDAMMMCAKLPGGIPQEFRRRLWLTLAEKHLQARGVNWSHAECFCFNEWSNPDDDELGDQIVKDLHRTGCSLFCGEEAEDNQAMLKRVLLAFARWNKGVGYCQGFNMLAAIILEVMERQESDALKVMIYLIEGVLPESYFANNLRGLSVDMAVFRDLLRLRLPQLSRHLEHLQHDAEDLATGTSYEPPLTNVFTMQWFLTLFSNCLPREAVMRVWDLTFLQGDEVLLRTALAIWDGLAARILEVHSADEFYTVMGVLTREMLTFGLMDANKLVQTVVGMAPFPFPGLAELRDKYTYNITPWTQSVSSVAKRGLRLFYSDDDEDYDNDEDDQKIAVATAFGLSGIFRKNMEVSRGPSPVGGGSAVSPSGFTPLAFPSPRHAHEGREITRPNLDISALKKQYARLRERQKQAHIILTASQQRVSSTLGGVGSNSGSGGHKSTPLTMNHLLRGKKALTSKTRRVVPKGVIPVIKPKKKAERKLSDSTGTRSTPQQQKQPLQSTGSFRSTRQPLKRLPGSSQGPPKVETLHWKDTPRRDRRASLPSGVKLLEGSTPSLGTLGVPSEMDDDDGGSSTSTELCDDDDEEEDKLSDLEADPSAEPRPATTSPRLETVHENGKTTPDPKKSKSEGTTQDKKQQPVSQDSLVPVPQVQEPQADGGSQIEGKPETVFNAAKTETIIQESKAEIVDSSVKEQDSEVFIATDPPLWDYSMGTGIPLEDLLAGKNLTAAEIIARFPFPSDVSFMKESSEGISELHSYSKPGITGSSSPSSTQHNVTPERSPVDSPIPRITSPDVGYEPSLTTKPSPNVSPSKSLSSTPSSRGSPSNKASRSPSKSPALSPSQSQDHQGIITLSLVGLPPVSTSEITQDSSLIPPKSPKITVEDEKSNIFEIYTGHPSPVTALLQPGEEEKDSDLQVGSDLENTSVKSEISPGLPVNQQEILESAECVTVIRENEKLDEIKDSEVSVLPVTYDNLEKVSEQPKDDKIYPDSTKEEFIWTKESYNGFKEFGSDGSFVASVSTTQNSSQSPESSVFDAICQRLKENVKTESDLSEVQTNFATKSGFLCLTVNMEEKQTAVNDEKLGLSVEDVKVKTSNNYEMPGVPVENITAEATDKEEELHLLLRDVKLETLVSDEKPGVPFNGKEKTSDEEEKLGLLVGDVKETSSRDENPELLVDDVKINTSGCTSPTISIPTEALDTKSWLSSLTMTVNSNMTSSTTPECNFATPLPKSLGDGYENIKISIDKEISSITTSESATSSAITISAVESSSVITTVDNGFSIFEKTYTSEPVVTDVDTDNLLTRKILDSLASPGTTSLNNGITPTSTTLTSCVSPITVFSTVVSTESVTTVFTFPQMPSGFSPIANTLDIRTAVTDIEKDLAPSENIVGSSFSVNLEDSHVAKALKTEISSTKTTENDGLPLLGSLANYQVSSMEKSETEEFPPADSGTSTSVMSFATGMSMIDSDGLPLPKTSTDYRSSTYEPETEKSSPITLEPENLSQKSFSLVTGPPSHIASSAASTSTTKREGLPLLKTSADFQISSLKISETEEASSTITKEEISSTMEFSSVATPATSASLAFNVPLSGEMTYSKVNIDPEISPTREMSLEEASKTTASDVIDDSDTSLEKEILSLIDKDQVTFSEAAATKGNYAEITKLPKETKEESKQSSGLSLEERILALLGMDERVSTEVKNLGSDIPVATSHDGILSVTTSPVDSNKLSLAAECKMGDVPPTEKSTDIYSSMITTREEGTSSPIPTLDRESSLSASLEGRISFFTTDVKDEGVEEGGAYGRLTEDKEDKNSDDNEAEAETDFFNGKDLSSEAIRQRLWKGVKSLSLDADVTLDPNLFCFLIQQSTRRKNWKGGERKMPKRRNSEVALQELVKENTEIIERILKQKSEDSSTVKANTAAYTLVESSESIEEEMERKSKNIPISIKSVKEKHESEQIVDPQGHKITKAVIGEGVPPPATCESQKGASSSVTGVGVSQLSTQNKAISPQSSKTFTPERKLSFKRDDSSTALSPTRPITFNPFPTRNVTRQPKEVAVKLGLYSPTKKTSGSSAS